MLLTQFGLHVNENSMIDDLDRKILGLVQQDADQSQAELGRKLGTPVSTVNERLRRLAKSGIIRKRVCLVDPDQVGRGTTAFIFVQLEPSEDRSTFLHGIDADPDIVECHHVTGGWNYLLKVRVSTAKAVNRVLKERLGAAAGVVRTETMFALSTEKETTEITVEPL